MDYHFTFARRFGFPILIVAASVFVHGCGGGGGGNNNDQVGTDTPPEECNLVYKDSFGRVVTCPEMLALPGSEYLVADGAGGGDGGAGGDGGGADGKPIINAKLIFTDVNGRTVETSTDANGYYRINIGALTSPIVATVVRDGNAWKSALVEVIEKRENFYTINLTGLTDVAMTKMANAGGLSGGSDAITPTWLAANLDKVGPAINELNAQISDELRARSMDPATFNPFTKPFMADGTGYDGLLDDLEIVKTSEGSRIVEQLSISGLCEYQTYPYNLASGPAAYIYMSMLADGGYCGIAAADLPNAVATLTNAPAYGSVTFVGSEARYMPNTTGLAVQDAFSYELLDAASGITYYHSVTVDVSL